MKWLFLALCHVLAQPSLPLLPSGVTINMVTQIQVTTGGAVNFVKSVDNSSTVTNRLGHPLVMTFDNATGILTVSNGVMNDSSSLKPGLVGMFLVVLLAAFSSNKQHTGLLLCLSLGLGVTVTGLVVADVTIRVPGCFHTEGANGATLVFDHVCMAFSTAAFQAPPQPVMAYKPNLHWKPITPNTSFLPANDHGQHYLDPSVQYEVWRNNFGKAYNETERDNFFAFTEACRIQNLDKDRSWTAACNQFAGMDHATWKSTILADNAAAITAGHTAAMGRRLLSEPLDLFQQMDEGSRRQLLQEDSFSWVGTGRLTAVKDQGQCGSCYAHGSSSQMEAQLAIKMNTQPRELSREQLKECSQGSPSCNGGYIGNMYTYAATANGLGSEADYPYEPSYDGCKSSGVPMSYKNTGYTFISKNELAFKAAVKNAPIAISVCADTWNNYMGGIFTGCANSNCVNHVVMLVGYGVDAGQKYWLFQNSWATWWGEAGFMRVPRTDSSVAQVGACGMTIYEGFQANNPNGAGGPTPEPPTYAPPTTPPPTQRTPTTPPPTAPTDAPPTPVPPTDCQGVWGSWSACTASCNGGTQSRTWQIAAQPTNGGAECPADQVQACNNVVCPGAPPADCLHISNSVLGPTGDGNYVKTANWNQDWCLPPGSPAQNPQYTFTNADGQTYYLYWWATNCQINNNNGVVTYNRPWGVWGLGGATDGNAYQWSKNVQPVNGVPPDPTTATDAYSFNVQFSACS